MATVAASSTIEPRLSPYHRDLLEEYLALREPYRSTFADTLSEGEVRYFNQLLTDYALDQAAQVSDTGVVGATTHLPD